MKTNLQTLSAGTRLATALAVVAFVSGAWTVAGHESEKAVRASAAAMGPSPIYVTLPPVEIVAKRKVETPETAFASNGVIRATNEL